MNSKLFLSFLLLFSLPVAEVTAQDHLGHKHLQPGSEPMEAVVPEAAPADNEQQLWTCVMHPQIKLPRPGRCPICDMELVPVAGTSSAHGSDLQLGPVAQELAQLETALVKREFPTRELRLVGEVSYDETQVKHITAWVPGRIERLFVDYTGIRVQKGDHMVSLYSPKLLSAQEELIQAVRSLSRLRGGSEIVRSSTARAAEAAREKLELLGLTREQVREIEKRGTANEQVTIYAPASGVVTEKNVREGAYVTEGDRIYTIADLAHLWVTLDAYESDLPWIRYGQPVKFTTRALPGKTLNGVVSFVSPIVEKETRTTRVRVNVDNSELLLKPGMFVTGLIQATLAEEGIVKLPSLAGHFICPMHPEIIVDAPGICPICGMELVRGDSLPFVQAETSTPEPPLVIPATAPLLTGKRAIVYVKLPDTPGRYEGREVVLGPKAGNHYIVREGLHAGEEVVTNGAFKLDADLQIRGLPSMMDPKGGAAPASHRH